MSRPHEKNEDHVHASNALDGEALHVTLLSGDARNLASKILFCCHPSDAPSKEWPRWQRPLDALPIDDATAGLIGKARKPRLLDHDALANRGIPCPYWAARGAVVRALAHADADGAYVAQVQRARNVETAQLNALIKDITKVIPLLQRIDDATRRDEERMPNSALDALLRSRAIDPEELTSAHLWSGDLPRANDPHEALADLASAFRIKFLVPALIRLANEAKNARKLLASTTDARRRAFAASIGNAFYELTGSIPAPGDGPFVPFLQAAADTTGKRWLAQCDWHDAARKVCRKTLK